MRGTTRRNDATVELYLPTDLRDRARERASSLGLSLSALVRMALSTFLEQGGKL